MPTILELFKGSNKDIQPTILDQTPVQDKFKGSTQEKSVKSDQLSKIEQEFKGVRFRSGVELNNPLLYGNQAIRIATRSTSAVEQMKQATGGKAGDGGLIGKGLGAITGGKFGKFVFGGKVTSLNQARDGINSRLGIPQNIIPTYVNNTGELQKGLEPDTMTTLAKIKNDAKGTLVGQFLKQTGGGTPKTIGRQVLGQGITLVKDKLRTTLFGNPNTLGANGALANDKWEYSSTLPYSKQIENKKFNTKSVSKVDKASTDITKKVVQLREDAKKKLGESASNATASLKQRLKGTESKPEIDKVLESKTKETSATAKTYEEKYNKLVEKDSVFTNLRLAELEKTTELKKDVAAKEEVKKPLGLPEGFTKPKLTGKESKPEIDKITESKTKETSDTKTNYTATIGDYKNEDVTERIDLSLVSPIKGLDRRKTKGRYGLTEYALFDPKNTTGKFSPNDPTRPYTGVAGAQNKSSIASKYGITNSRDALNQIMYGNSTDKLGDWIPLQIGSVGDSGEVVHFRTLITGFSETVSPSWDSSKFVGNPYNFYTYSGVERSASFTLRMYCMSADELAIMWQKINWLTSKAYPTIVNKLVNAPFIKMTIGSIYKNKIGFINSLSYTINDDITWESDIENMYLPKVVDVQIEFKLVESAGVETNSFYSYKMSSDAVKGINNKRAEPTDNVIGTDPITKPQPASGVDFKQVQGIQEIKIPPPPKVDSTGVEQTEVPPAETDTTPKMLDTGKPAETPKAAEVPASTPQIAKRTESDFAVKRDEAEKKYRSKGYPDWFALKIAMYEAGGRILNEIKKIDEKTYYVEVEMKDGEIREQMVYLYTGSHLKADGSSEPAEQVTTTTYEKWVSDNGGKDPMDKFFTKEQMDRMESSNQQKPTTPF